MWEDSIQEHHANDHAKIDEFFQEYQENRIKNLVRAKEFFQLFQKALKRHILWEEEMLFPIFEDLNKANGKELTKKMRQEHLDIEVALSLLADKIVNNDFQTEKEEEALWSAFKSHNEHEEHDFYPALDSLITDKKHLDRFVNHKS